MTIYLTGCEIKTCLARIQFRETEDTFSGHATVIVLDEYLCKTSVDFPWWLVE